MALLGRGLAVWQGLGAAAAGEILGAAHRDGWGGTTGDRSDDLRTDNAAEDAGDCVADCPRIVFPQRLAGDIGADPAGTRLKS
jgi:hypothetical protein